MKALIKNKFLHLCIISLLILICSVAITIELVKQNYIDELSIHANHINERVGTITSESYKVFKSLDSFSNKPCSDNHINLMRRLLLKSDIMTVVGYGKDLKIYCSNMGNHEQPLEIFAVQQLINRGVSVFSKALISNIGDNLIYMQNNDHEIFFKASALFNIPKTVKEINLTVYFKDTNELVYGNNLQIPLDKKNTNGIIKTDELLIYSRTSSDGYLQIYTSINLTKLDTISFLTFIKITPLIILTFYVCFIIYSKIIRHYNLPLTKLKKSLKYKKNLYLKYQPIINTETQECNIVKVIVMWDDGDNLLNQDEFFYLAEKNNLMVQITNHLFELMISDGKKILMFNPNMKFVISTTATSVASSSVQSAFLSLIAFLSCSPNSFIAEIEEKYLIGESTAKKDLERIRHVGCPISINGFGTRLTSLDYLANFSYDIINLDSRLVHILGSNSPASATAENIISFAKNNNKMIFANGLESIYQEEILKKLGVKLMNGELYSSPLKVDSLLNYLKNLNTSNSRA